MLRVSSVFPTRRFGCFLVLLSSALLATGCGGGKGLVPVSGSVKYSDGTAPNGLDNIATVTFQSVGDGEGATGDLDENGNFRLTTDDPYDGAYPGEYKVTVVVMEGYPDGKHATAEEYRNFDSTPLTATVKASGENKFDFTIERP